MDLVREIYGISERRACRALVQYRSTQRYRARVAADEEGLRMAVVGLASRYGRYGYRRVSAMLQRDGVEGESQEGGADMEAGGAEGARPSSQREGFYGSTTAPALG